MDFFKKYFFVIFVIIMLVVIGAYWAKPAKAFLFDKVKIEKELQEKNAEKQLLTENLEEMQNNPDDLEKEARNNGYAKKGETMLKIVPENVEEKNRRLNISAFLIIALIIISGLIVSFALSNKKANEDSGEESEE